MEIYSTVLWHLHAEVQLSTLAQDLVAQDRNSPAAWCATGNLFSAQTEHETAIKFFQRAIQVRSCFFLYFIIAKTLYEKKIMLVLRFWSQFFCRVRKIP